ncbi:MAG: ADP-heptose:LPS heptosyltransferase [Motiliproteus sp.]|jgi:ADP-heptose:LPS heptosyltransferase
MLRIVLSKLQLGRDIFRRWLGIKLFDYPSSVPDCKKPISQVLIVRLDAKWGDAIVSSFFIPELKKVHPGAQVTVLVSESMANFFLQYLGADKVIVLPKRPAYSQLKEAAQQIDHCGLAIHLTAKLKMKDLYFLSRLRPDNIAGMDDEVQAVNIKMGQRSADRHYAEIYADLLGLLGATNPDCQYIVPRDSQSKRNIEQFLASCSGSMLAINPYGSGHSRQLTPTSIKKLITTLNHLKPDLCICLLLTPDKREEVAKICTQFDNVICYQATESIYDSIEIVAQADWVVSVDTAIVHIATGLRKPTLGLYNPDPDNFSRWHPNNPLSLSFNAESEGVPDINRITWPRLTEKLLNLIE